MEEVKGGPARILSQRRILNVIISDSLISGNTPFSSIYQNRSCNAYFQDFGGVGWYITANTWSFSRRALILGLGGCIIEAEFRGWESMQTRPVGSRWQRLRQLQPTLYQPSWGHYHPPSAAGCQELSQPLSL